MILRPHRSLSPSPTSFDHSVSPILNPTSLKTPSIHQVTQIISEVEPLEPTHPFQPGDHPTPSSLSSQTSPQLQAHDHEIYSAAPPIRSNPSLSVSPTHQSHWYDRFKFSTVQFSLLALLAFQSIAIISILSTTVAKIEKEVQQSTPQLRTISTYLGIFILANFFLILMTIDLLLNKNVVQLIALCIFNSAMSVYGAVLPNQIQRALYNPGGAVSWNGAREGTSCNMYLSCFGVQYLYGEIQGWIIAIPVIGGLVSILMAYLTWLIYKEFGWEIFKLIGADLGLKRILQKKYLFYMLQKFTFFFFLGLSLQYLILASSMSTAERVLSICAVPYSLAFIILGGIAVSREVRWMMVVYYVCWTGAAVYFLFKLVRLYHNDSISAAVRSLTLFSVLTILLLFATGIVSVLCYINFGKGLLETPALLNESMWAKFWNEKVMKGCHGGLGNNSRVPRNSSSTSKSNQIHPRRRMTLTGMGPNFQAGDQLDDPDHSRQKHSQSPGANEMIQLKNHQYRMSMD